MFRKGSSNFHNTSIDDLDDAVGITVGVVLVDDFVWLVFCSDIVAKVGDAVANDDDTDVLTNSTGQTEEEEEEEIICKVM